MNRRDFLRNASLLTAGAVALDQIGWTRRLFPAWGSVPVLHGDGVTFDDEAVRALMAGAPVWDHQAGTMLFGRPQLYGRQIRMKEPLSPCPWTEEDRSRLGFSYSLLHTGDHVSVDERWQRKAEQACRAVGEPLRWRRIAEQWRLDA